MACFVLHNIAKERNQPDFEDDAVMEGDMFEIVMSAEEKGDGPISAREESRIRRLGFETRQKITNTHFRR